MLKRKISDYDASDSSIFGDVPARNKRLFRPKHSVKQQWAPQPQSNMSELLDFVLQHEEAFKNQHRLASLYADFRQQLEINPDGYHANIAAWTKALADAARAGVIPSQGTTRDLLNIRTADDLARALQHPQYGKPTCLPAVFHEAVQKKEMMPLKDFMGSNASIYKTSWVPTPWSALQWSLRTVGVLGKAAPPDKLAVRNYVVLKNIEVAGDEILKKMKEHTSTADRVLSRRNFLERFSHTLNPAAPLTNNDLNIMLVYLARDKQAISYDAQTIKFKPEHETQVLPITEEDAAIAGLRDTLANINAQIPPLMEKIASADAAAREAVAAKQMVRAKAALRSKKLAETALAQRSDVALQLEGVYSRLQQAADQVEIVEAMRAGAAALKGLNEKVGGAEGVQGVVDAVNEQMATTEEITNIINETDTVDEVDIEDEFEALERVEKEKKDREEAAKTAARLAELEEVERKQKEQQAKEAAAAKEKQSDDDVVEEKVEQASQGIANISFLQEDEKTADSERTPAYA
ncbi:Snf7-domain-containing protein [Boeremia exigua]|uniref:Snf7-domain-containing protein n=1 Tax=Boeremia exigua TaxID=749465 RepID=UPI001E8D9F36|nr:Snf7-domain-containing protein [Boeremia exigua]KAH6614179.1 Snf7-domain-containing protein [Boeremia exigua]